MSSNLTYACQTLEITFIFLSPICIFFPPKEGNVVLVFFPGIRIFFFEGRLGFGNRVSGVGGVQGTGKSINHQSHIQVGAELRTQRNIQINQNATATSNSYVYILISSFFLYFCRGKFEPLVVCKT